MAMVSVEDLTSLREAVAALRETQEREQARGWLNVKDASAYLGYPSEAGLRALIKRNEVPYHRQPNGRIVLAASELDEWILATSA